MQCKTVGTVLYTNISDMRISDTTVERILKQAGQFSASQLKAAREQAETEKKRLQEVVIETELISEADLTKLYADEIDVPYTDLVPSELLKEILKIIPEKVARQHEAVAFDVADDGVVQVAMEDPDDIQAINFLHKQLGRPIHVYLASTSAIQAAIELYGDNTNVNTELAKVIAIEDKEVTPEEVDEQDVAEDSPIAQTVNLIIDYGVKSHASDVHIEPRENNVIVRYRIDGVLHEANKLPRKVLGALVSRIKILANLKIDEHRAPQDGRFKISINDHVYALRVSTLPVVDGEKVVIRILDESSKAAALEELGYWGESLRRVRQAIVQPHGMVLVTGPTGSGKSTSLFSVLSQLNEPTVNISTVEDPVEYRIVGVNQTQVNPQAGMTFASGLRSLLRQDPNIIMVGEIRDGETADLAVQAALTGHLVFSTLHTNNAATCLPRLLDMGIEPFLIASTVRVVIGQRLVRKLCMDCRETYEPDAATLAEIRASFRLPVKGSFAALSALEKQAMQSGIGTEDTAEATITDKSIRHLWRAHEGGCNSCNHAGYRGRIGVYEALENSPGIQKLIVTNSTSEDLDGLAVRDGMITMRMDGFIKAFRGQTSIEEIMRVTGSDR